MLDNTTGDLPRPLNEREREVFVWCGTLLSANDAIALKQQIEVCLMVDADDDGLRFNVAPDVARLSIQGIDLDYEDDDGEGWTFL